jgi:tetratricopeptide (TPR) repeat protein
MQQKRNRWVYVGLILALLALLGFSGMPLIGSILQTNQSLAKTTAASTSNISQQMQAQLESQAKGYQSVLDREPNNNTALKGLLEIRLKQGDIKAAIEPLEKLANLNNNLPEYTILLAQAKQQIKDFEGAAAAYRQAIANNPTDLQALAGMTQLLIAQNRPEGAIGLLQDTIKGTDEGNKNDSESIDVTSVKLLLGQVYAKLQRYGEAISVYDSLAAKDSKDFRPVLSKALIFQEQGKNSEAKSLFKSAFSIAPSIYKDQIEQAIDKLTE